MLHTRYLSAVSAVLLSGMLLYSPYSEAVFIRANCDLRTLNLSNAQKSRLRTLRQHYKRESDNVVQEARKNRNKSSSVVVLFEESTFDIAYARRIAQEHHNPTITQTIEELRFYHEMYQILSPQQRNIWLALCVKQ